MLAHSLGSELGPTLGMDVLSCSAGPINTPNFYRESSGAKVDPAVQFMIQEPMEVADECLHALGGQAAYSVATGVIQKINRFVSNRLLPHKAFVDSFTEVMKAAHGPKE